MATFWVNDRQTTAEAGSPPGSLLRYLRDDLRLTGTKDGCNGAGHCGTCTVLVDGQPQLACRLPLAEVDGRQILTIEGLAESWNSEVGSRKSEALDLVPTSDLSPLTSPHQHPPSALHPLQQSFIDHHAVQCGFCTPGMILAAKALLDRNASPDMAEIRQALSGNLCRCTGYQKIFAAILALGPFPPLPSVSDGSGRRREAGRGPAPAGGGEGRRVAALGRSVPNKGDEDKVRGRATYSADVYREGMLIGRAVWSAHPHAEIVSIDISAARAMSGVAAVITARDVPGVNLHGPILRDQPVLAEGKVRFIGEPVAVVFAETEAQAQAAARAVRVEYRPLPGVFSPLEAMQPGAPLVHDSVARNILTHQPVRIGDAARALAEAEVVVEGTYHVPFIEHAYLEPEAAVAEPDGEGGLHLWCGIQNQFQTLGQIADALALPVERINMINLPMGGAFGGKCDITVQAVTALGALVTGRPVKMTLTRAESLRVHPKRHAFVIRYRTGANRDGRLVGVQAEIIADTGAYASWGTITAETLATFACGPYVVPNATIDLYAVYTNNITGGAMRGFGAPETAFAVESQMDRLARRLQMDPFTLRRINGLDHGRALYIGQILEHSVGYQKTLTETQQAVARLLPECQAVAQRTGRRLGVGVASGFKSVGFTANWPDPASAELQLLPDGRVRLCTGCADFGQGSTTTVAQIAAETLGLDYDRIFLKPFESRTSPDGGPAYASRTTYVQGNTVRLASELFRSRVQAAAAEAFGLPADDVLVSGESLVDARREAPLGTLADLARRTEAAGQPVAVRYDHHQQSRVPTNDAARLGDFGAKTPEDFMYSTYAFATQAAIVAVDERTGRVEVLKMIAAHDVGRAIHPENIEGQLQGACAIGLGTALWERFRLRQGWNLTTSLRRTLIPDTLRIPEIIPIIVEDDEPSGPYGAKGIAEIAAIPSAAAVVNAIRNALGVEFDEIPVTRGKVLQALRARRESAPC